MKKLIGKTHYLIPEKLKKLSVSEQVIDSFRSEIANASTELESLFYHLILLLLISRLFVCHSIYMQKSLPRYSGSLHRSLKYSDIRTQSVLPVSMEYKISTWKVYLSQSPRNTKHNVGNYKFSIQEIFKRTRYKLQRDQKIISKTLAMYKLLIMCSCKCCGVKSANSWTFPAFLTLFNGPSEV